MSVRLPSNDHTTRLRTAKALVRTLGHLMSLKASAGRVYRQVAVIVPSPVAALLKILLKAGAHDQIATLRRRDPAARVSLDDPRPSVWPPPLKSLLESLQEAGAREQAAALAERLPGAGKFWLFRDQEDHRSRFRFGREPDGRPVKPWDWDDLDLWLVLRPRGP